MILSLERLYKWQNWPTALMEKNPLSLQVPVSGIIIQFIFYIDSTKFRPTYGAVYTHKILPPGVGVHTPDM
jgi:hypothetical protein